MHSTITSPAPTAPRPRHIDLLRDHVDARMRVLVPRTHPVYELVSYHLGWNDEHGHALDDAPLGKMLRPALCLTVASGYTGDDAALDAAVALELLHAFSLVHDDIEDGDRLRRHRPTLWALRGVPLAINAGDSLFALAQRVLIDAEGLSPSVAVSAFRVLNDASLRMIEGQHDDLEFERRESVTRDEYLRMTAGKTGALIGASLALGAIFGEAPACDVDLLNRAGVDLGIAFQAIDDSLSVWGCEASTGKPAGNDVSRGKKCLPVIIANELMLPLDDLHSERGELVREETLSVATTRAQQARARIGQTSLSADAIAQLDEIVEFILSRES